MDATEFLEAIEPELISRSQDLDMGLSLPNTREAISSALQQTVLLGGKRLRPLLTYLTGKCLGIGLNELDLFARSIEQVHAASLSHDDVIDNATLRRGKDSINILTSNKKAILAGDYLLANVICELTDFGNLKIVSETSRVISELSEGEWLQMELIDSREYTKEIILKVANYKTASVMKWCCKVPALLADVDSETTNLFELFGYHLGIGFQLIDDTLDFSGNKEKEALIDLQNGIVNMVLMHWLDSDPDIFKRYQQGEDLQSLWDEKNKVAAVESTKVLALNHLNKCSTILDQIEKSFENKESKFAKPFKENRAGLETILTFLKNREN